MEVKQPAPAAASRAGEDVPGQQAGAQDGAGRRRQQPRHPGVQAARRGGGLADGEKLEPNSLLDGDDKLDIPTFLRKHLD